MTKATGRFEQLNNNVDGSGQSKKSGVSPIGKPMGNMG